MNIDDVTKGLATGLLIGILLTYSFRPKVPYPAWMLQPYEHPWLFIVLMLVVIALAAWDAKVGGLAFLVVATLLADYYVFGRRQPPPQAQENDEVVFDNNYVPFVANSSNKSSLHHHTTLLVDENFDSFPGDPAPF